MKPCGELIAIITCQDDMVVVVANIVIANVVEVVIVINVVVVTSKAMS